MTLVQGAVGEFKKQKGDIQLQTCFTPKVTQSTNKPGVGAKGATEDTQTQTRMRPSLGWTVPMVRVKAMGSRATVPWDCQEPQDLSD